MLKRRVDDQIWLISQPDHAAVSGYLAAHWGNREFSAAGGYADCPDPELIRSEVVLAIAEHDNGWWEWEADPELDPNDGLPLGLLQLTQEQGFARWRLGVPRFAEKHPYVALLISFHAYWLHAYRVEANLDASFAHPLFGDPDSWPPASGDELEQARRFVAEQKLLQGELIARLRKDPVWASAAGPQNLNPHVRLLQVADALSLSLCFGGTVERTLAGIPRKSWEDRVTLELHPVGSKIVCRPYPFDQDPLPVVPRARVLHGTFERPTEFQAWWQSLERREIRFEFCSGE